jgi:hypothetical protein
MNGQFTCPDFVCGREVAERQRDLLRKLQAGGSGGAGSEWLLVLRLATAIQAGAADHARELVTSCGASGRCDLLRHYVAYRFDGVLLDGLPPASAGAGAISRWCEWAWVPQPGAPNCAAATEETARYWWLADPLWSRQGNERYSEHLARQAMSLMHTAVQVALRADDAEAAEVMYRSLARRQPPDHVIMQGFPNSIRTLREQLHYPQDGAVVWYAFRDVAPYVHGGSSFLPAPQVWANPAASAAADWQVDVPEIGCAPTATPGDDCLVDRIPTSRRWESIPFQSIVLRRTGGDSVLIAAELPRSLWSPESATLMIGDVPTRTVKEGTVAFADGVVRAVAAVPDSGLASLEVVGDSVVARVRLGTRHGVDDAGVSLSQIVFVRDGYSDDEPLLPQLLAGNVLRGRAGVYFEMYGFDPESAPTLRLTIEQERTPALRRALRFLRLASGFHPIQLSWEEGSGVGDIATVAYELDFSTFDAGEYVLGIEANVPGQRRLTRNARFVIP